jgi:hypothetical protein
MIFFFPKKDHYFPLILYTQLTLVVDLEPMKGSGPGLQEDEYHLVRHAPQVRHACGLQITRGCPPLSRGK